MSLFWCIFEFPPKIAVLMTIIMLQASKRHELCNTTRHNAAAWVAKPDSWREISCRQNSSRAVRVGHFLLQCRTAKRGRGAWLFDLKCCFALQGWPCTEFAWKGRCTATRSGVQQNSMHEHITPTNTSTHITQGGIRGNFFCEIMREHAAGHDYAKNEA